MRAREHLCSACEKQTLRYAVPRFSRNSHHTVEFVSRVAALLPQMQQVSSSCTKHRHRTALISCSRYSTSLTLLTEECVTCVDSKRRLPRDGHVYLGVSYHAAAQRTTISSEQFKCARDVLPSIDEDMEIPGLLCLSRLQWNPPVCC